MMDESGLIYHPNYMDIGLKNSLLSLKEYVKSKDKLYTIVVRVTLMRIGLIKI